MAAQKKIPKELKEKPKEKITPPPQKRRYVLMVEGMVPVKLLFETWAFDENEALKQLDNPQLIRLKDKPDIDIPRVRRRKVQVKDGITSLIKIVKNF